MKKIIMTIAAATAWTVLGTVSSNAQNMYDALTLSENDYYGTARSISLGNAVTAIGGDIGTIGINPAGSAVNSFSQIVFSPMFSIAKSSTGYNNGSAGSDYEGVRVANRSFMAMPSCGMTTCFDMSRSSGLKSVSIGFVVNTTGRFTNDVRAAGGTSETSMMGAMASAAGAYGTGDMDSYYSSAPWQSVVGYRSGMIYWDDANASWMGASETSNSEGNIYLAGPVAHSFYRQTRGSKNDILMNIACNISDQLFLGFNLGMPVATYSVSDLLIESAVNQNDFPQYFSSATTNWVNSTYNTVYNLDASGIYAKLGAIWTPCSFLRFGAAIQTPTYMDLSERYTVSGTSSYAMSSFNAADTSPEGTYEYSLSTPMRSNFGVAFVLGTLGFVSMDWEFSDYSTMTYHQSAEDDFVDYGLMKVNDVNSLFAGKSRSFRLGAELRLGDFLSFRAGLNRTFSPEYTYIDNQGYFVDASEYLAYYDQFQNGTYYLCERKHVDAPTVKKSFGLGYSSGSSFFADFAFCHTSLPVSYSQLYDNYLSDAASPSIRVDRHYREAVLTVGWRF